MKLQVDELCEFQGAEVASKWFLSAVQAHVCLEVARGAEALLARGALVRFLPGVHEVVLLQMCELGEGFSTGFAGKRTLSRVRAEVNLQVGQLAERFRANVAFVVDFPILLSKRIGQSFVSSSL